MQQNKIDQNANKANTATCLHFIGNFTHVTGMSEQIAHIRFNFRLCNGRFWSALSFTLSVSVFGSIHSHVSAEYIEPLPCRQRILPDKIAPKYNHGNHKRFNAFVKDRSNMDDRSVILWMKQKRFKPGFSTSTELFITSVRKVSLTISIFNCAVSALYVTKALRRVTAQLPILRQLGNNARPGKTGSVYWSSTSHCILWATVISCGWSMFNCRETFQTPCIKWNFVRCVGHRE